MTFELNRAIYRIQRPDFLVPAVDGCLQALHLAGLQGLVVGHRQLAAEVEQAVLAGREHLADLAEAGPHGLLFGEFGYDALIDFQEIKHIYQQVGTV